MRSPASRPASTRTLRRRALSCAVAAAAAIGVLTPEPARAHFILKAPASWMSQDSSGLPEKLGPCGDEAGGTPTGIVTGVHPGETITITIDEVVFHAGHYRIALAADRSQLPPEPLVTATSATPCGSVPIDSNPTLPVLADGVFPHTAPFSSPQSIQVTIPSNITCTKCTLQVIEFMSNHPLNKPGGCFYHHCADLSIEPGQDLDGSAGGGNGGTDGGEGAGSSGGDGGSGAGSAGSSDGSAGDSSGGCAASPASRAAPGALATLAAVALVGLARRRRRATRSS